LGEQRIFTRERLTEALLLGLMAAALLLPRLKNLDRYVFIDESYYLKHGASFYWAVDHAEWEKTNLVIHPGVTTNWLGAFAFWRVFPEISDEMEDARIPDLTFRRLLEQNDLSLLWMLVYARQGVVLVNSALLTLAYLLGRRLFDRWAVAVGVLLAGFDPFFFDFSRFLHVDGFVSTFMLTSILAFVVFLAERRTGWAALSGVLAGLAFLTKGSAVLLLPAVIGCILIYWWGQPRVTAGKWGFFRQTLSGLGLWLAVAVVVIFSLYPALWRSPVEPLGEIFSFIQNQAGAEVISPMYFNGQINPTGAFGLEYLYYYPLSYLWRASPVVLAGLALLLAGFLFRKRFTLSDQSWRATALLVLFAVGYAAAMTLSVKKFDRYILPSFLPLALAAGIGYFLWLRLLLEKVKTRFSRQAAQAVSLIAALAVVGLQGALVWQVFPYGLSYFNPLLGGGAKAPEVMMVGYGEGLDQAGEYMVGVPGTRNLTIYSFYSGVFGFHYLQQIKDMPWYAEQFTPEVLEADYWIVYHSQRQRGLSPQILEAIEGQPVAHSVWINGIEYVRIYRLADFIPLE
jgi:hypothetical protein